MEFDALIIGSGPAGYAAAIRIGQRGGKVALFEKDRIGGECLNYGCIPSKALIELSTNVYAVKKTPGMKASLAMDLGEWQKWKWSMIGKLTSGVETLCKAYGGQIIKGEARIVNSTTVAVGDQEYTGKYLIIATGSSPVRIKGMEDTLDNRGVLDLKKIPDQLVVIGGGYIGIEIGTAMAKLGSHVTIVEMMDSILPGIDPDLVNPVSRKLKEFGIEVLTATRVKSVSKEEKFTVTLENGRELVSDQVLLTVGRAPNTTGFGMESLGLKMNGKYVWTDETKRTSIAGVYAIGDVSGEPMLAHKAYYDAEVAAANIMGEEAVVEYQAMPFVVYSDPEISSTGKKGDKTAVFPLAANGRAMTMDSTIGTFRIYTDESGTITGAGIVAPHSSEMISEISLAVEAGLSASDIGMTIHPHPTVTEGLKEAAEGVDGKPLHFKTGR
ncbi:MAG: dihydrolipoyl dehydrogenase [Candidatus Thermoplasmatota archaeon]|nr:dihydrolipoyl dehydrogenase [Candidatus Thermoplasmatota archaeon]MCL5785405.1 dihydrolipoyl dehydrogenase [Candidatus Thermoplasmatota archaeon]